MENQKKQNQDKNNIKTPNLEKPYAIRNFVKEIKRVTWPTKKKNYRYFLLIFVFIIFLIGFFALVSLGANEIIKNIGAN